MGGRLGDRQCHDVPPRMKGQHWALHRAQVVHPPAVPGPLALEGDCPGLPQGKKGRHKPTPYSGGKCTWEGHTRRTNLQWRRGGHPIQYTCPPKDGRISLTDIPEALHQSQWRKGPTFWITRSRRVITSCVQSM